MRRKEQVWWMSATVVSLGAFSFFAGLGLRGLVSQLSRGDHASAGSILNYTRLASAAPRVPDPDVKPAALFFDVLMKLRTYYVDPLPSDTHLSVGAIDTMLNSLGDPNTRLLTSHEVDALRAATLGEYRGLGAVLTIQRYNSKASANAKAETAVGTLPARKPAAPGQKDEKAPTPAGIKTITVVAVLPGSPAEKAGLVAGDRITEIDGRWVAPIHVSYRVLTQYTDPIGFQDGRPRDADDPEIPQTPEATREREELKQEIEKQSQLWKGATELSAAMQLLITETKGDHELTIERAGTKPRKVQVTFGEVKHEPLSARTLDANTGYIRILSFNTDTQRALGAALADFQKNGVKNLVFDLRDNAGGDIDAARAAAGLVAGDIKFAVIQERDPSAATANKMVSRPEVIKGARIVLKPSAVSVLVDKGTAGSAELFAAALRDHLRAPLVGSATFGDGSEQEVVRLDNGAGFSITRAKLLTSTGVAFDGKGLKVDVAPQGDPLEAAVKALAKPVAAPAAPQKS